MFFGQTDKYLYYIKGKIVNKDTRESVRMCLNCRSLNVCTLFLSTKNFNEINMDDSFGEMKKCQNILKLKWDIYSKIAELCKYYNE